MYRPIRGWLKVVVSVSRESALGQSFQPPNSSGGVHIEILLRRLRLPAIEGQIGAHWWWH